MAGEHSRRTSPSQHPAPSTPNREPGNFQQALTCNYSVDWGLEQAPGDGNKQAESHQQGTTPDDIGRELLAPPHLIASRLCQLSKQYVAQEQCCGAVAPWPAVFLAGFATPREVRSWNNELFQTACRARPAELTSPQPSTGANTIAMAERPPSGQRRTRPPPVLPSRHRFPVARCLGSCRESRLSVSSAWEGPTYAAAWRRRDSKQHSRQYTGSYSSSLDPHVTARANPWTNDASIHAARGPRRRAAASTSRHSQKGLT